MRNCCDCLYCKVSANSTPDCRLCFCSLTEKKTNHKETYWLTKSVCEKFVDMEEKPITLVIVQTATANKPKPLLRKRYE